MADVGRIIVQAAELRAARQQMDAAVQAYNEATEALRNAANTLASGWEGDGQVAFVESQEQAFGWYGEISSVVDQIIAALLTIIESYVSIEEQVKNMIRS